MQQSQLSLRAAALFGLATLQGVTAHLAAYTPGMYCPKVCIYHDYDFNVASKT